MHKPSWRKLESHVKTWQRQLMPSKYSTCPPTSSSLLCRYFGAKWRARMRRSEMCHCRRLPEKSRSESVVSSRSLFSFHVILETTGSSCCSVRRVAAWPAGDLTWAGINLHCVKPLKCCGFSVGVTSANCPNTKETVKKTQMWVLFIHRNTNFNNNVHVISKQKSTEIFMHLNKLYKVYDTTETTVAKTLFKKEVRAQALLRSTHFIKLQ